jgi:hypothetical protein
MNLEDLEKDFIAEGWGNGSLHPTVVRDSVNYWNGGSSKNDFYVGFDFHYTDWEALFFGELNCPRYEPYVEGEDIVERDKRWYAKFQQCTSEYPMLNRIFDMYADAGYTAEEVSVLREQCLTLQAKTKHSGGWRALAKLIIACNKALDSRLDLLLICD